MSHSKRNTSLAFFTSHERSQLRNSWGSQEARLVRDSFLPFASCSLCLLIATDSVACAGGPSTSTDSSTAGKKRHNKQQQCHIFCRECAMANLLAQRKEIKRVERLDGSNLAAAAVEEAREDDEARRRAVDDFEKVQAGLAAKPMTSKQGQQRSSSEVPQPSDDALDLRSSDGQAKRKLDLEEKDFSDFREEDRAKARKSLRDQKLQDAKSALPSFWVPSLTPDQRQNQTQVAPQYAAGTSRRSTASQQPLCPCSTADTAHHFSLKTLVTVKFSEEDKSSQSRHHEAVEDSRKQQTRICPACNRQLSNASKAMLTKPCGHVLCGQCTTRFVLDSQHTDVHEILKQDTQSARCFVCHEDVSARQPGKDPSMGKVQRGLVEISSDGTGFAKGGRSLIKKVGVAFQC